MSKYTLKSILSTFSDKKGQKRTLFNPGVIGGISNKIYMSIFLILPFLEYFAVFNPYIFEKLGIATCIIVYIVFLSIIMISIFFSIWNINKNVIKKITKRWNEFFPKIDLKLLLSSGRTPYSEFFEYYSKAITENKSEEELHRYLLDSFDKMEDEHKELLDAMIKDNKIKR